MFIWVIVPVVVSFLFRWFRFISFISICCAGSVFVRINRKMIPSSEIDRVSFVISDMIWMVKMIDKSWVLLILKIIR